MLTLKGPVTDLEVESNVMKGGSHTGVSGWLRLHIGDGLRITGSRIYMDVPVDDHVPLKTMVVLEDLNLLGDIELKCLVLTPVKAETVTDKTVFRRVGILEVDNHCDEGGWQAFLGHDTEVDRTSKWEPYVRTVELV